MVALGVNQQRRRRFSTPVDIVLVAIALACEFRYLCWQSAVEETGDTLGGPHSVP